MNEDKVDYYLRMYIQKDIPITREQANEINEYKCELKNKINNLEEVIEEVRVCVRKYCSGVITNEDIVFVTPTANILQILDKGVKDE
jgi:hypothetical protein